MCLLMFFFRLLISTTEVVLKTLYMFWSSVPQVDLISPTALEQTKNLIIRYSPSHSYRVGGPSKMHEGSPN